MLESRIIFTPVIADSIRHRNISTDTLSPEQPKFNIYIYIYFTYLPSRYFTCYTYIIIKKLHIFPSNLFNIKSGSNIHFLFAFPAWKFRESAMYLLRTIGKWKVWVGVIVFQGVLPSTVIYLLKSSKLKLPSAHSDSKVA